MPSILRSAALLAVTLCLTHPFLHAQADLSYTPTDGGGGGVLESIYVPNLPHAPFTLSLHTEWIQTLRNGGTVTLANTRPILRDGAGRIYMERWLLVPRGSDIRSEMTTIQIDDPVAGKFYNCFVRQKVCQIDTSLFGLAHYQPLQSGPLKDGKGTFQHEDLGTTSIAGAFAHTYRDTTTVNTGVLGNDAPMAVVREFSYSADLGFNLLSQPGLTAVRPPDLYRHRPQHQRARPQILRPTRRLQTRRSPQTQSQRPTAVVPTV